MMKDKITISKNAVSIKKPVVFVFVFTIIIMTTYEVLKQFIWPNISIWESHILTIIFTAMLATTASIIALRQYQKLYKILSGILSICCVCKKVRDIDDTWKPVEDYIDKHSEASFSHGYCPECYDKAKKNMKK
ncbi:MAG: hypothetical protein JW808_00150 [Victivallales bacterium]|nr:hypothetical protein [Victivallales bacterium]